MTAPISTRLYLVRHCDVENPGGLLYGHLPGFGLSARGRSQAESLGSYFEGKPVRRIYASPLQRAQETAEIIAGHLQNVDIVTTEDLVEAEFGRHLQGVPLRQIPFRRPLWWLHMAAPGLLPNDESVTTMARRVGRPLRRLLIDHPGEGGICVSHGDPIQAFWLRYRRRPIWAIHRLECVKSGRLELDYEGSTLDDITYVPPESHAAPHVDGSSAAGVSHA